MTFIRFTYRIYVGRPFAFTVCLRVRIRRSSCAFISLPLGITTANRTFHSRRPSWFLPLRAVASSHVHFRAVVSPFCCRLPRVCASCEPRTHAAFHCATAFGPRVSWRTSFARGRFVRCSLPYAFTSTFNTPHATAPSRGFFVRRYTYVPIPRTPQPFGFASPRTVHHSLCRGLVLNHAAFGWFRFTAVLLP